jgi:hypothetical protein
MKILKNYSRAIFILFNLPFAFTHATKQKLIKKAKLLMGMA